jgi:hypothetical protein
VGRNIHSPAIFDYALSYIIVTSNALPAIYDRDTIRGNTVQRDTHGTRVRAAQSLSTPGAQQLIHRRLMARFVEQALAQLA